MREEVPFPFQVVEILNGTLTVGLLWMLIGVLIHLYRSWEILSVHWGKSTAVLKVYLVNKPEIALATFIAAFLMRTFLLWYVRWLRNHDLDGLYLVVQNDVIALILLTGIMLVGIFCWVRVINPFPHTLSVSVWIFMMATSVGFGVGMHYLF